jgi:hypothetical protein
MGDTYVGASIKNETIATVGLGLAGGLSIALGATGLAIQAQRRKEADASILVPASDVKKTTASTVLYGIVTAAGVLSLGYAVFNGVSLYNRRRKRMS